MPVEINRVVADHTCDLLFAPTNTAIQHLSEEGLEERSWLSGDIMVDTLEMSLPLALEKSTILEEIEIDPNEYFLVT